jgi:predicted aspartyl protease
MKFKNVMIFILSLITVWIVVVFFCYKGYLTNIEVGQIQLGDCRDFTTQDGVIFDTGAQSSYISSNNIGFPIFLFPVSVNDGEGNNKILPMYFTQYFEVNDKVKIKNFAYFSGPINNQFEAIIGMNVLSKLNMLFHSTQNTLDIKSFDFKPQIPSSATILQYKDRISPKVTLRLDNVVIDDILIDTGFDGDLAIDEHYIEKLKSNHSCDSMISTFLTLFDTQTVKKITFSELYINKRLYKNIQVLQQKKRLLGSKFLKRFDKVFWDSKNLTVYMWNENDEY